MRNDVKRSWEAGRVKAESSKERLRAGGFECGIRNGECGMM
jgi:hypothetical protein